LRDRGAAGGAALSLHGDAGRVAARVRRPAAGRAGARRASGGALMATRDPAIGIFDSGVGGLTVVHRMLEVLPDEHLIYLGDTARYPYGSKSATVVSH